MVALVAWPEGKLNLSTIFTVATLNIVIEAVDRSLGEENCENLVVHIIGWPSTPGESFEDSNNDNVKDEADQKVHRGLFQTGHIDARNCQHQPRNSMAGNLQGLQMSPDVEFIFIKQDSGEPVGSNRIALIYSLHQVLAQLDIKIQNLFQFRRHFPLRFILHDMYHTTFSAKKYQTLKCLFRTQWEIRWIEFEKLEGKLLHEEVDMLVNLKPVQVVRVTLTTIRGVNDLQRRSPLIWI